jgi:SAM-dependent methyltransferase
MDAMNEFSPEAPGPLPDQSSCIFYHSMTYPDGETIEGAWDIRGLFDQYIGNYPIRGKSVLDVGTAGGFLAFEAEKAGARVTALDALSGAEFERIPFRDSVYHRDRRKFVEESEAFLKLLRNGFWYSWNRYQSNVEMVYAPLARLPYWDRRFDVVLAGAILEHLSDPVAAIASMAGLASEAVIIAFTPVIHRRGQYMETANDWSNPDPSHSFTFWTLSRGLYERVFGNLGSMSNSSRRRRDWAVGNTPARRSSRGAARAEQPCARAGEPRGPHGLRRPRNLWLSY